MSFYQKEYKGEPVLVTSTVLGFKQWKWDGHKYWGEGVIRSRFDMDWAPGINTASCKKYESSHDSPAPEENCSCGFYAHYLPLESYTGYNQVLGVIEGSGKILMGTKGFRAEKARVVALCGVGATTKWFDFTNYKTDEGLIDFCTSMGVPYFSTVKDMVHQFPISDLTSLGVDLDKIRTEVSYDKKYEESVAEYQKEQQRLNEEARKQVIYKLGYQLSSREYETLLHLGW